MQEEPTLLSVPKRNTGGVNEVRIQEKFHSQPSLIMITPVLVPSVLEECIEKDFWSQIYRNKATWHLPYMFCFL